MRRSRRLPLEELQPYLLDLPDEPTEIEWSDLFGNDHPVELEIGFGKGLFLVTNGESRPDTNFVGVEIVRKYQLFTATRVAKRSLPNVRLACADALLFLRDFVRTSSVNILYAFYPDPWWKKRHHKRRLFRPEFVRECERVLEPGQYFHIITDVEEYYEIICELIDKETSFEVVREAEGQFVRSESDPLTNFERKAREQGRGINRLSLRKLLEPELSE